MVQVVIYARSSTFWVSVEEQLHRMRTTLSDDTEVVGEFSDLGPAGKTRTGMAQAMSEVMSGHVNEIVVVSLDRLARTRRELAEIQELGGRLDVQVRVIEG